MSDFFLIYAPLWVKIFSQTCTEAPTEVANSVWPPAGVLVERYFWRTTIVETSVITIALLSAVIALVMWWKKVRSNQTLRVLGLQIVCLCAMAGLGYKIVRGAQFRFDSQIYGAHFFMWLGNLGFYVALAACVAISAWLVIRLSGNRSLHGAILSGNLIVMGTICAGWGALVYAMDVCSL